MTADSFFGNAAALSWARKNANEEWEDIPELLNVIRGGVIIDVSELIQMTEMGTGKPRWWQEPTPGVPGRPKMKIIITLRCDGAGRGIDERNSADSSDVGSRQLHVHSKDMREAIGTAFRATGNSGIRVGSELYLAWTGKRPSRIKNAKAARTWAALYVPCDIDVTVTDVGNPFGAPSATPVLSAAPSAAPVIPTTEPGLLNPFG